MGSRSVFVDFVLDRPQDAIALTADETDQAEHNFKIILETAEETSQILSRWTTFDLTSLRALVRDLSSLLALVRREMNQKSSCRNYGGPNPVAQKGENIPERLRPKAIGPGGLHTCEYQCLCPLTKFLQLIADALSDLNLRFTSSGRHQWDKITPLWRVLNKMQSRFKRPIRKPKGMSSTRNDQQVDLCPGVATVIMFHERHGRFAVTGTAPRYVRLTGLQKHAFKMREDFILGMERSLPTEEVERIRTLIQYSEGIKVESNAARRERPQREPKVGLAPGGPGIIAGCNASFGNNAGYRPACLMDWFRFDICRPNAAQVGEDRLSVIGRLAFEPRSCAEWELYVTIQYKPDPSQPRPPPKAVRHDTLTGTPKPATWDTKASTGTQRLSPGRKQPYPVAAQPQPLPPGIQWPKAPSPVVIASGPWSKAEGQRIAMTFDQKLPPRHPAADQIVRPKKRSCFGF